MKKITFAALVLLLLLSSCASLTVWDDSQSAESQAVVQFHGMNVDSYNGISVTRFRNVRLPAGEAVFTADVGIHHAGVNFLLRGMEFGSVFEAGNTYIIRGSTENMQWGVTIWTSQIRPENKVAFIPFRVQPVF